ncbi:MAG: SDR family oxidoreductase [Chloroflexi bacterium]|nr:SDR family oxidoreductase [Chloroflexota bacterium]
MRLQDKVAVITGASSGIGRAAATLFAREGARVVVADIDEVEGHSTVSRVRKQDGQAEFIRTDVSSSKDVQSMVGFTVEKYGKIDVLFANAGLEIIGLTGDTTEEEYDHMMEVLLKGVWLCAKYCLPAMIENGGGSIVNTASVAGLVAWPGGGIYGTAKAGVIGLTRAIAVDYARHHIRCNCICPGNIWTPLSEKYVALQPNPAAAREALDRAHPLGRSGSPEEAAQVALFLASDESSFVTGATYTVDGGLTAR